MPNKAYRKGIRKEYKIIQEEKELGRIAFRSAGSHSPFDVISIDKQKRLIKLIQCKTDYFHESAVKKLEEQYAWLNQTFDVEFWVR